MVLEKNDNLVLNICKVLIRSTDQIVDVPTLQRIYHTPSLITYFSNGSNTVNGNLFDKNINLSYPGLGATDFEKFNNLIKGTFQVYMELENGEIYEVATTRFPMSCSSGFDINRGHQLVFASRAPEPIKYIATNLPGDGPIVLEEMFDYDFDFNLA